MGGWNRGNEENGENGGKCGMEERVRTGRTRNGRTVERGEWVREWKSGLGAMEWRNESGGIRPTKVLNMPPDWGA